MKPKNSSQLINALKEKFDNGEYKQSNVANKCNISQSTISRYLENPPIKVTGVLIKLCNYAKIDLFLNDSSKPMNNEILMNALEDVWNGTEIHAKKIARVIRALN